MKIAFAAFLLLAMLFLVGVWLTCVSVYHYFPAPDGGGRGPHPMISSGIAIFGGLALMAPQAPVIMVGEYLRTNTTLPIAPEYRRESLLPFYSIISALLYAALIYAGTRKKSNKAVDSTATRVTPPAEQEPRHGQP